MRYKCSSGFARDHPCPPGEDEVELPFPWWTSVRKAREALPAPQLEPFRSGRGEPSLPARCPIGTDQLHHPSGGPFGERPPPPRLLEPIGKDPGGLTPT